MRQPAIPANGQVAEHLSTAIVPLFKGVLYRQTTPGVWNTLLSEQARVADYVAVLGLELVVDEAEGFAYLKSSAELEREDCPIPRLITRRALSFQVSLLLALLRKKLAEHDAGGSGERLILSLDDIAQLLRVFLPAGTNEAAQIDKIEQNLENVERLGFIRKLRGQERMFEVCRILKNFVDANWLSNLDQLLAEYQAYLKGEKDE